MRFYRNNVKEKKRKIINQIQQKKIKEYNNLKNNLNNNKSEYKKINNKLPD